MDDLPYSPKIVCSDKEILLSRAVLQIFSSSQSLLLTDRTQQLVWTTLRFNDDIQFQSYQKIIGIIHPSAYLRNVGKHETKIAMRGFGFNF